MVPIENEYTDHLTCCVKLMIIDYHRLIMTNHQSRSLRSYFIQYIVKPVNIPPSVSPFSFMMPVASTTSQKILIKGIQRKKVKHTLFSFLVTPVKTLFGRKTHLELDYFRILISVFPFCFTMNSECMLGCDITIVNSKKHESSLTCI